MEYLGYVISGIVFVVGLIIGVQGYKKYTTSLDKIISQKKDDIAASIRKEEVEYNHLCLLRQSLQNKIDEQNKQIEQIKYAADECRKHLLDQVDEEVKLQKELKWTKIQNDIDKHMAEEVLLFKRQKASLDRELDEQRKQVDEWQSKLDAINAANLRQRQLEEKEDFYSIQISHEDQDDIQTLQELQSKFNNHEVVPKLIWEVFVRRPAQEMIKRVTSGRDISGIYKVTNKKTQEAYIGKSTNISTRWQNHLRASLGLDGAVAATFHNRLAADGLWNYTWEIIEEVPKEQLSEREAFYINLYGTKNQLNMKNGG